MSSHNVASAVGCNFHLSSDHSSWPESFIEVRVVLFIPLLIQSLVQGRSFSGWGNVNCWMMNAAGEGATRSYMHSNELAFYVYHYSLLLLEGWPIPKWERRAEGVQSVGQRPPESWAVAPCCHGGGYKLCRLLSVNRGEPQQVCVLVKREVLA